MALSFHLITSYSHYLLPLYLCSSLSIIGCGYQFNYPNHPYEQKNTSIDQQVRVKVINQTPYPSALRITEQSWIRWSNHSQLHKNCLEPTLTLSFGDQIISWSESLKKNTSLAYLGGVKGGIKVQELFTELKCKSLKLNKLNKLKNLNKLHLIEHEVVLLSLSGDSMSQDPLAQAIDLMISRLTQRVTQLMLD